MIAEHVCSDPTCRLCDDDATKQARARNLQRRLPDLSGSPAAVRWAERIRDEKMTEAEDLIIAVSRRGDDERARELLQRKKMLRHRSEARFWIARRLMSVEGLLEVGRGVS